MSSASVKTPQQVRLWGRILSWTCSPTNRGVPAGSGSWSGFPWNCSSSLNNGMEKGQLVTRDQVIDRIWGKDVFLDTDNRINAAICKIRQVLKDDPEQPCGGGFLKRL